MTSSWDGSTPAGSKPLNLQTPNPHLLLYYFCPQLEGLQPIPKGNRGGQGLPKQNPGAKQQAAGSSKRRTTEGLSSM